MTDYTMDSYGGGNDSFYSEYGGSDEAYPEWQEFWDESAQAKYWYNNVTGEASWTKPPELGKLRTYFNLIHSYSSDLNPDLTESYCTAQLTLRI